MIPLGTALETTGATALLVSNIAILGESTGPIFMLVVMKGYLIFLKEALIAI